MSASGQPAEEVFCAEDSENEGSRCPVQCRSDKSAPRLYQRCGTSKKDGGVSHVFDDLERQYGVELLASLRDRFGRGGAVVDRQTHRLGMGARDADRLRIGVNPRHGKAEPAHWLGDKPPAA